MTPPSLVLPDLDLQPGELYLARSPAILRTILGSCVGVTFWCRRIAAGALCHGVLPHCPGGRTPLCTLAESHRYVDASIRYLLGEFFSLGARRNEIVVKVFGGADVLPTSHCRAHIPTIGAQNCASALAVLREEGLDLSASDIGGQRGRRIHFHTGTGKVLLHRLSAWKDTLN